MTATQPATDAEQKLLEQPGDPSVGTWTSALFVVALSVFHASLLFSYFMIRHEAPQWPPEGHSNPPLAGMIASTVILFGVVVPVGFAYRSIRRDQLMRLLIGLVGMLAVGIAFLTAQLVAYIELDLEPLDNVYSSLIVAIAGYQLIVTLVVLGMGVMVLARTLLKHFSSSRYMAVEVLAFSWGFIVVSWLLTAATIFLTPYVL